MKVQAQGAPRRSKSPWWHLSLRLLGTVLVAFFGIVAYKIMADMLSLYPFFHLLWFFVIPLPTVTLGHIWVTSVFGSPKQKADAWVTVIIYILVAAGGYAIFTVSQHDPRAESMLKQLAAFIVLGQLMTLLSSTKDIVDAARNRAPSISDKVG